MYIKLWSVYYNISKIIYIKIIQKILTESNWSLVAVHEDRSLQVAILWQPNHRQCLEEDQKSIWPRVAHGRQIQSPTLVLDKGSKFPKEIKTVTTFHQTCTGLRTLPTSKFSEQGTKCLKLFKRCDRWIQEMKRTKSMKLVSIHNHKQPKVQPSISPRWTAII